MAIDTSLVGRAYPPSPPYEVSLEKVREFADAIGDPNPVYRDPDAARDAGHSAVIAPPTFVTIVNVRSIEAIVADPDVAADYGRMVHADQRFVYHRPVLVGDRLVVTTYVDDVMSRGGNDMLTIRGEITTDDQVRVVTARATLVFRGESAAADGAPKVDA